MKALNTFASASTHTLRADVAYGSGSSQMLDVYIPTTAAPAGG